MIIHCNKCGQANEIDMSFGSTEEYCYFCSTRLSIPLTGGAYTSEPTPPIISEYNKISPKPNNFSVKIPLMITSKMESLLITRGYSQSQINAFTPQQANDILSSPPPIPLPAYTKFECKCGQSIEVNSDAAGQTFNCPSCNVELTVPNLQ